MNNLKNFVEIIENYNEFELEEMLENANIEEHLVDLFHIYVKYEGGRIRHWFIWGSSMCGRRMEWIYWNLW